MIGASPRCTCSCQVQPGVMTRSPSSIGQSLPSTTVEAPLPSITKRSAFMVWRCGRAFSPGQQDLQRGGEIGGGAAGAAERLGIGEGQHPPLDRGRVGDLHGVVDQRPHLLPFPMVRRRAALAHLVGELVLPQRREVGGLPVLADLLVGAAAGRGRHRRVGCTHGASPGAICGHYSKCARGASASRGRSGMAVSTPAAPRMRSTMSAASAGHSLPRQATWPSGRTSTRRVS